MEQIRLLRFLIFVEGGIKLLVVQIFVSKGLEILYVVSL